SYTYTFARNTLTGDLLLRRPQNKAGLDLFYKWDAADFGLGVIYVGERPDVYFSPPVYSATAVTLSSYAVVNLMASYQFTTGVKFFARVNNLFNQSYEEVYGYG